MKNLFLQKKNLYKNLLSTTVEPEKTEKKKPVAEEETPELTAPVEEKKAKSNIDLHIVGKIDLDTLNKETSNLQKKRSQKKNQKTA